MAEPTHRLFGVNVILEALRGGTRTFSQICLQKGRRGPEMDEVVRLAQERRIPIEYAPREHLDRLSGHGRHQGVVGVVSAKGYVPLEEIVDRRSKQGGALFLMALDGVEDPHNLGAVIRTAEAAGADAVVIPERRAVGVTPVVAKSSAGAVEYLPVVKVVNLYHALEILKRAGAWVIGLTEKSGVPYDSIDLLRPLVLVFGSEGSGLRARTMEACDELVSLPMQGRVSSLNVSVAAGIMAYEVIRQRRKVPGGPAHGP